VASLDKSESKIRFPNFIFENINLVDCDKGCHADAFVKIKILFEFILLNILKFFLAVQQFFYENFGFFFEISVNMTS